MRSMIAALSMIKSKDLVWYFLSPKEYKSPKKSLTKRTTPSGFWKSTGKDRKIKEDKRRDGVVIGIKKTLVYHEGKSSNAVPTPWIMHEYHITCLPLADQVTFCLRGFSLFYLFLCMYHCFYLFDVTSKLLGTEYL